MVCNSEAETLYRFKPLTAYLSQQLNVEFEPVAVDTMDFTRRIDELDFIHANSLLYVILHRFAGVELLAAEKAGSLAEFSQGAIVGLKKSNIAGLQDLKGRTMIFGPMYAPTSYLSQLDLLLTAGIDPEEDMVYTIPTGSFKHEKVIYAVLFGAAEVGAFPMLDFERMAAEGRIEREDFNIMALAEPIPYCTFGATQKVEENLAAAFRKALLELTGDDTALVDGEQVSVLRRAGIDGYRQLSDSDYDSVRDMARRTNMPPYQSY